MENLENGRRVPRASVLRNFRETREIMYGVRDGESDIERRKVSYRPSGRTTNEGVSAKSVCAQR